jgi:hypothetical protein
MVKAAPGVMLQCSLIQGVSAHAQSLNEPPNDSIKYYPPFGDKETQGQRPQVGYEGGGSAGSRLFGSKPVSSPWLQTGWSRLDSVLKDGKEVSNWKSVPPALTQLLLCFRRLVTSSSLENS